MTTLGDFGPSGFGRPDGKADIWPMSGRGRFQTGSFRADTRRSGRRGAVPKTQVSPHGSHQPGDRSNPSGHCGEGLRRQLSAKSDWIDFCHATLSFEIVLPDACWFLLFRLFRRLRVAKMVSLIVHGSALPPIS